MRHTHLYLLAFALVMPFQGFGKTKKQPNVSRKELWKAIDERTTASLEGKKIPPKLFQKCRKRCTPLTAAIDREDLAMVQWLLAGGANPNAPDRRKWMPLHRAVAKGSEPVAALLLTHGADVNHTDPVDDTPLACSIRRNLPTMVEFLLQQGADSNKIAQGEAPLKTAIKHNPCIARTLIAHGCDVNARGPGEPYPVVYAILKKRFDLASFLIEKGATLAPSEPTTTALHAASCFDRKGPDAAPDLGKIVAQLPPHAALAFAAYVEKLEQGDLQPYLSAVDVNHPTEDGTTALHYAIQNQAPFNVARLLQKGADPNRVTKGLVSPLHEVVVRAGMETIQDGVVMRLLIARGAHVNHFDARYSTLARAVMLRKIGLFRLLLANKADPNLVVNPLIKRDSAYLEVSADPYVRSVYLTGSSSLLHLAALHRFPLDGCREILAAGVDVNARDAHGSTPLHYAAHYDNIGMVKLLLTHGALLLKNDAGQTPLTFRVEASSSRDFGGTTTILYDVCGTEAAKYLNTWQKQQKALLQASKREKKAAAKKAKQAQKKAT